LLSLSLSAAVACNPGFAAVEERQDDDEGANPETMDVDITQKVTAATITMLCSQWLEDGRRRKRFEEFIVV
jgi:hypothetical protein